MRPADPTTQLRVARAEVSEASPRGLWHCAFCGCHYPIHDGWLVDHFYAPTRQATRSYVCGACAAKVRAELADPASER